MKPEDFDFFLPEGFIAERPIARRDESRLLVLQGDGGMEHRRFRDLPDYLMRGDMLLINRTKVLPVKLRGRKRGGGELEILLARNISGRRWEILSRGGYTGPLEINEKIRAEIEGGEVAELEYTGELREILWESGEMPLPSYLGRRADDDDKRRYQTVYAEVEGSIAAPTAGLHFTGEVLRALEEKGVLIRRLTLHVGRGTFAPIRARSLGEHVMEEEQFEMETSLMEEVKRLAGRLFTVGTTTTRAVEGFLSGRYRAGESANGVIMGRTDLFIYPGYEFRAVRGLITNFHLPRSTPLMLAGALAGREKLLQAYEAAVGKSYRFFSYGDAMLIL